MKDITEEINLNAEIPETQIPEEPPEPLMTVEDFVGLSAQLLVTIRKVPTEYQQEWIQKYTTFNITLLKLISFDKAIGLLQLSNLKPETSLIIGLGILVGSAFFIKIPTAKDEFKPSTSKKSPKKTNTENNTSEDVQKIIQEINKNGGDNV